MVTIFISGYWPGHARLVMLEWYAISIFGYRTITMFLRSTLVKSGNKKIRYWKLVETTIPSEELGNV